MQIIQLELGHLNFYCPATGEPINEANNTCNETAKSLQGFWVNEIIYEPHFNNTELEKDWNNFVIIFEKEKEDEYLEPSDLLTFLEKYDHPNWVVFEITTTEFACGPISSTVWFVIDMNTTK
jgi:hypothetical protein